MPDGICGAVTPERKENDEPYGRCTLPTHGKAGRWAWHQEMRASAVWGEAVWAEWRGPNNGATLKEGSDA